MSGHIWMGIHSILNLTLYWWWKVISDVCCCSISNYILLKIFHFPLWYIYRERKLKFCRKKFLGCLYNLLCVNSRALFKPHSMPIHGKGYHLSRYCIFYLYIFVSTKTIVYKLWTQLLYIPTEYSPMSKRIVAASRIVKQILL